jgi:hypothetical protein
LRYLDVDRYLTLDYIVKEKELMTGTAGSVYGKGNIIMKILQKTVFFKAENF